MVPVEIKAEKTRRLRKHYRQKWGEREGWGGGTESKMITLNCSQNKACNKSNSIMKQ